MPDSILDGFLTESACAEALNKSQRTLRIWRHQRCGPPFTRLGKEILYRKSAVLDWLQSNEQQPVRPTRRRAETRASQSV